MMMIIGDAPKPNPTVQIPAWDYHFLDDPIAHIHSTSPDMSHYESALSALQRFLPARKDDDVLQGENGGSDDFDIPVDAFSCDDFRMFDFKVKKCARARSHDWTECPFAHPGEKARRRDPRKYHYSGTACPDFRKGVCGKGDCCEYAHGVFECWLHPARYRTQPCKDGTHCRRRVCFFAHTPGQLRLLTPEGSPGHLGCDSPGRLGQDPFMNAGVYGLYSPPSSPTTDSPPVSPSRNSVFGLAESMRGLQINKVRMGLSPGLSMSPPAWGPKMGSGFGSPRSPSSLRPGFMSLPTTPIQAPTRCGRTAYDIWQTCSEEEPVMERVESGRKLREKIYEKLSKENSLDRVESGIPGTHFGWVSELLQ